MKFAWILHNNASNTARLVVEGMKQIGFHAEHIATREDLLGIRIPDLRGIEDLDTLGNFPDRKRFSAKLASDDFWDRMPSCDHIVFTINVGRNHNAARAAALIRTRDLFHKLIYLDEDESGHLNPDYRDMFLRARLSFVWRPRLYQMFRVHPHVVNYGFNGVEDRYLKFLEPLDQRQTSVFYRGRVEARPQRVPFIQALRDRNYPEANILPTLQPNQDIQDLYLQHLTGNRNNIDYYRQLAGSKVCVILHGGNPVGYQFWEAAGLACAIVTQGPRQTQWYRGGSYPTTVTDYECWDPPFLPGKHFLTFESPDEMVEKIDYLISNDAERIRMASACHEIAVGNYSASTRAEKFLQHVLREP